RRVARDERQAQIIRQGDQVTIDAAVIPETVAVDFYEHVPAPEEGNNVSEGCEGVLLPVPEQVTDHGPLPVAGQCDKVTILKNSSPALSQMLVGQMPAHLLIAASRR